MLLLQLEGPLISNGQFFFGCLLHPIACALKLSGV
jgi:hypothetical protein